MGRNLTTPPNLWVPCNENPEELIGKVNAVHLRFKPVSLCFIARLFVFVVTADMVHYG